ncbi:MAG: aminotransferase class V-fold PLP-dependent enzyme [bacterium]|nr:aminotransferase class V-fold PLP-dependent enzyme [bacterium]
MDIAELRRSQFPITERYIYLNHASVAPVSVAVCQAMGDIVQDVAEHGMAHIAQWQDLCTAARCSAACLIGAHESQIAFLKNTTDGLIAVALGVDWRPGDNVVIARGEFPANVYPWLNLRDRGVSIRWVAEVDGCLRVEDFDSAIDARTRVLSVSSVEFFSGFRNDLTALGTLCRERDILFVVDGIQSVGALQIDVGALGIDCLAADGHKWLMGPEGCALFYTSPRALARLRVAGLGWASVLTAHDFLNYDTELHADARRFETGSQNTAGIAGLKAAIDLLLDIGMVTVEARVLHLARLLADGVAAKRYQLLGSRRPDEVSGIITFQAEDISSQEIARSLTAASVQFTDRAGTIRLSPHVYNTEAEIDLVLRALPQPA